MPPRRPHSRKWWRQVGAQRARADLSLRDETRMADGRELQASALSELVARLTVELSQIRRRGIDRLHIRNRHMVPIETPVLLSLAEPPPNLDDRSRGQFIRTYLDDELRSYALYNGDGAAFIRDLLFDGAGQTPGPGGASALLHAAQQRSGLPESTFRRVQHEHFRGFAMFLVTRKSPSPRSRHRWQRRAPRVTRR